MALIDSLAFYLVGSLLNDQIPTFLRATPANWEGYVNSSWKQVAFGRHQPRFSSKGTLLLEGESVNLLTYPQNLAHSSWVKGSSMVVFPDQVIAPDSSYKADRISVSATTGNDTAQTISKSVVLNAAEQYTASFCLRLADGRFGATDYIEIADSVVSSPQRVYLAGIYNNKPGNFITFTIPFTSAGSTPAAYDQQTPQSVTVNLRVNRAVSIDWAYGQIEPGAVWTSFISQDQAVQSRDRDFLQYPYSPIAGLSSFVFYANLEQWRGDGAIVVAGDFVVDIFGGKLRAICGSTTCTAPDTLPAIAKIAVRVSKGLGKVRLYVNQVLVAEQPLSDYQAAAGRLNICGAGVRSLPCLYFFNQDLSDGSAVVGGKITSDLLLLNNQDTLTPELSEDYGLVVLPSVRVPAGQSIQVRFPLLQRARQAITAIASSNTKVAQVDRVTVQTIVSASAVQTDWVAIGDARFSFTSDATPTTAEIAAGLAAAINTTPKKKAVTAAYTSGASFTVTADVAGDGFDLIPGTNLSRVTTTANVSDTYTITVPNAVDYTVGTALVFRDYAFICEVAIASVNTGSNQLSVKAFPNSQAALIKTGDVLIQPNWQLQVGRNNYFVHHLEDFPDIRAAAKPQTGFALKNVGSIDRTVTPYVKIAL
jgi:hypothetical protein